MRTHKHLRRPTRTQKTGMPPGRMVYIGDKPDAPVRISIFDYDAAGLEEHHMEKVEECEAFRDKFKNTWINVDGLHDIGVIDCIGKM